MNRRDKYIKSQLQQDKVISDKANEVFKNFERRIEMENNKEPKEHKIIKLSLNQAVLAFSSLIIVGVLGGNLYAHIQGKPNLYSAIKGIFVKEDKYTASEVEVNQTVESNGIKLTLKTVAMDENILITKYIAEGEKLANEFYTYPEFEEDMIKVIKLRNVLAGNDIGEKGYDGYTQKDVTRMRREIVAKLQVSGITEEEAINIEKVATEAYTEYIGAELGHDGHSSEKAKELITQAIAIFESKVSSKYKIMQSDDTLQNFGIEVISQKIEKSGNQYIIYNVYNVDTISDIASKFDLDIEVSKIGTTEGTWSFNAELEKARLDTRVETIDFYENNSINVQTSAEAEKNVTIEAKKLVISDFSTVLMIQTRVKEEHRNAFVKYGYGLPCIYVVRDEQGNALGTGTLSEDRYELVLSAGGEIKYTDRIILENVDKDTKKLHVDIFVMNKNYADIQSIELDIETARIAKEPVELTQSYASKDVQISFKYPGNWATKEPVTANDEVIVVGPEDVDGNAPTVIIRKISQEEYEDIKEFTIDYGHGELLEKGEITIAGSKGYYGISTFLDVGVYEKSKTVVVENNGQYYYLRLNTNTDVQYSRYEETFNRILETIEYVEPEKSYRTFSRGGYETVKLYEDNALTISFDPEGIKIMDADFKFEANKEYEITGHKASNSNYVNVEILRRYDDHYGIPMIYVIINNNLFYVDVQKASMTGKFEIVSEPILKDIWSSVEYATDKMYDYYEKEVGMIGSGIVHQVKTKDGKMYILRCWDNEVKIIEYVEKTEDTQQPEQQEPDTSSKYENMSYESFEINNGVIKQYEDNTVTVEWNDAINNHENKLWEVKPNIEYVITGLDGKVKSVHNIIKDRQEKNMQAIKILTDKGTLYGRFDLKTDYTLEASNVGVIYKVETVVLQQSAYNLVVITENDNVCNVNYDMYTTGKAPSKKTIYNCLLDYCEPSAKLWLNEPIENAFNFIAYLDNGDGNYKADVRVKIFDSSIRETKSMRAVIVFDAQNNNFKVETFEENPKGGGGY